MLDIKIDPFELLRPRRRIVGVSAVLLPFTKSCAIDWDGFERHLMRTLDAGLTPAVNMDTGYISLIDNSARNEVLRRTKSVVGGSQFIAGAYVHDQTGDGFDLRKYLDAIDEVRSSGGTPILLPSHGLTRQEDSQLIHAFERIDKQCDRFLAFELSEVFVPSGRIFSLEVFRQLLELPSCIGLKHSSLSRVAEWKRLAIRNQTRPDFMILTGNDLAIDMVMYGSDYLLGLSTFAPDLFAKRDEFWRSGDPAFFELNDTLQYLGQLAFRHPVPAYRHSAAQFLKIRGWISSDATHPQSPTRPMSDLGLLHDIAARLGVLPEH